MVTLATPTVGTDTSISGVITLHPPGSRAFSPTLVVGGPGWGIPVRGKARSHRLGQHGTHRGFPGVTNVDPQDRIAAQNLSLLFLAFKWRRLLFSPLPFSFLRKLKTRPSHFGTGEATRSERMACGERRDGEGGRGSVGPRRVRCFARWVRREHWIILLVPLILGSLTAKRPKSPPHSFTP